MIEVQGLHKSYGHLEVLRGLDLQVQEKEIVSVIGASGAGKSTLLHLLGTLDTPDNGTITIGGHDLGKLGGKSLSDFRNAHIGFIFQFHHLLPEFTALENVCIPAFMRDGAENEIREKAMGLLELLGIADRATHKPSELSGGELQRAAVARSLINDPDVVLADEPSGNLDSKNAKSLHELFLRLRDDLGQTFVIVTHNADLAAMSDRTLEITDGVIA